MTDETRPTTTKADFLGRWTAEKRIEVEQRAKQFVIDCLVIFGQHDDAANEQLVLSVARKVMRSIPHE